MEEDTLANQNENQNENQNILRITVNYIDLSRLSWFNSDLTLLSRLTPRAWVQRSVELRWPIEELRFESYDNQGIIHLGRFTTSQSMNTFRNANDNVNVNVNAIVNNMSDTYYYASDLFDLADNQETRLVICGICRDNIMPNYMKTLPCYITHQFHTECIDSWLTLNSSCPICRTQIERLNNERSISEIRDFVPNEVESHGNLSMGELNYYYQPTTELIPYNELLRHNQRIHNTEGYIMRARTLDFILRMNGSARLSYSS